MDFLKACDDVKAGATRARRGCTCGPMRPTRRRRRAPAGPTRTSWCARRTLAGQRGEGRVLGAQRARRQVLLDRWDGVDLAGKAVRLPQYNWGSEEFQQECEKIVRFWMDTGIDGMMIDAVNWYVGCDWAKNRKRMTDVIASYGGKYSQPEGAGAFHDDPVPWVTDGGWTCVQDYGLGIFWEEGQQRRHEGDRERRPASDRARSARLPRPRRRGRRHAVLRPAEIRRRGEDASGGGGDGRRRRSGVVVDRDRRPVVAGLP